MPTTPGWGKEISNAIKIICNRSDVPQKAYNKALLIMSISSALNQYFNSGLSNLLFEKAYRYLHSFFKGPSLERKNLSK